MKKESYISNISLKLYVLFQRHPFLRNLKNILFFTDALLLIFIKKPKKKNNPKKQIFIMYNYAFGDGIIFLNSISGIRKIYPNDKYFITLICQKGLASIYENSKLFDEVISYNLTESTFNVKKRFKLFKLLRNKYYDIVLDPIGANECTTNIFMSRALCAENKITIIDKLNMPVLCPNWLSKLIYNQIIEINEKSISLLEYYAYFLRGLGLDNYNIKLESINSIKPTIKLPKNYFIVFPSASTELKRWSVENYAELIRRIYDKSKLTLLFCGTKSDMHAIQELKKLIENIPYCDIVGKTSLLEFIDVIKNAKFVITNDTSTYHIGVINQVPTAIITGGYTYDRYVSYKFEDMDKYLKPYIIVHKMSCFNCDNNCTKLKKDDKVWPCLRKISIDSAWTIVNKMIDDSIGGKNEHRNI